MVGRRILWEGVGSAQSDIGLLLVEKGSRATFLEISEWKGGVGRKIPLAGRRRP